MKSMAVCHGPCALNPVSATGSADGSKGFLKGHKSTQKPWKSYGVRCAPRRVRARRQGPRRAAQALPGASAAWRKALQISRRLCHSERPQASMAFSPQGRSLRKWRCATRSNLSEKRDEVHQMIIKELEKS